MDQEEFLKIVKEKGFDVAVSINMREENNGWLCPCCKSPVEINGTERYETLLDHVSNPNREVYPERDKYQCTNDECITRKNDIFWDYHGDRYGRIKGELGGDNYFIDKNDAPFGSYSRQANVEIYKKGLKSKTYLHPAWCMWFLQPYIEYEYTADKNGNVLSTRRKIKFLRKEKGRENYLIHFSFCWHTWSFLFSRFKRHIEYYKKDGNINELKSAFEHSYNRSWEYRTFEWFVEKFYNRYYKLSKNS